MQNFGVLKTMSHSYIVVVSLLCQFADHCPARDQNLLKMSKIVFTNKTALGDFCVLRANGLRLAAYYASNDEPLSTEFMVDSGSDVVTIPAGNPGRAGSGDSG